MVKFLMYVYVLVFSRKLKKMKKTKCMYAVSFLGIKQNYLHTPLHIMHTHQC